MRIALTTDMTDEAARTAAAASKIRQPGVRPAVFYFGRYRRMRRLMNAAVGVPIIRSGCPCTHRHGGKPRR